MDTTDEQMPPTSRPPLPEKGEPPEDKPDTGSTPDMINPGEPDGKDKPADPMPDMNPDGQDPIEGDTIN
jgi:hypothetical protein